MTERNRKCLLQKDAFKLSSLTGRQHWLVEQELPGSGLGYVILRPNAFMQTLLPPIATMLQTKGVILNPLGSAGIDLYLARDFFLTGEVKRRLFMAGTQGDAHGLVVAEEKQTSLLVGMGFYFF